MLAQAQECVWQWAVMGMITSLVIIRLMTSRSRSRLERDHSKVGSSGRSPHLLAVRSLPVLQVSVLYDNARSAIRNAVTPIWGALPSVSESCAIPIPLPISETSQRSGLCTLKSSACISAPHRSIASQSMTRNITSQRRGYIPRFRV
jgi:hypothetical protein